MKKAHGRIDATATSAKKNADALIDATANLAVRTTERTGIEVHRAGDLMEDAGASMAKGGHKVKESGKRILKLAE